MKYLTLAGAIVPLVIVAIGLVTWIPSLRGDLDLHTICNIKIIIINDVENAIIGENTIGMITLIIIVL